MKTTSTTTVHPQAGEVEVVDLSARYAGPLVSIKFGGVASLLFGPDQLDALDDLEQAVISARAVLTRAEVAA